MKKIFAGLLIVSLSTISTNAQVPGKPTPDNKQWKRNDNMPFRNRPVMGSLNLTDAQKDQLKKANEEFRNKMELLNTQRETLIKERKDKISNIFTSEQKSQLQDFRMKKMRQMQMIRQFRNRRFQNGQFRNQQFQNGQFRNRNFGNPQFRNQQFRNQQFGNGGFGRQPGAGRFGPGRMGKPEGNIEQLKIRLGLTDEQVSKIKASNKSFAEKRIEIGQNQSLTQDQKKEQFESLQKQRQETLKSVLTPEQQSKMQQFKGNIKEKQKDDKGKTKAKGV